MNVVIVGAGGHGRVVLEILRQQPGLQVVGFIDTNEDLHHTKIDGINVLGDIRLTLTFPAMDVHGAIVAIGDNTARRAYKRHLTMAQVPLVNAIHPQAILSSNVCVDTNVVICAGAILSAGVHVWDSVIINTGAIIDHETMLGTACHIGPGACIAGRVVVELQAMVGIGATVIQNITIGKNATVGAGAVVTKDVPDGATVVGVPAQQINAKVA